MNLSITNAWLSCLCGALLFSPAWSQPAQRETSGGASTDAEVGAEDGEEYAEGGEEGTEDGEEYAEDGEEYAEDGEEGTEGGEEYAEDGEEYAEDGEEYAENGEEYAEDGEEYAEDGEEDAEESGLAGEPAARPSAAVYVGLHSLIALQGGATLHFAYALTEKFYAQVGYTGSYLTDLFSRGGETHGPDLAVGMLLGRRHNFEASVGLAFVNASGSEPPSLAGLGGDWWLSPTAFLGYRLQTDMGFLWRMGVGSAGAWAFGLSTAVGWAF